MAKETIIKGKNAFGREDRAKKSETLSQKLQTDLETAILRLFESSAYCDVELVVESDSVLAHSCILKARVARFYEFLITECQVFHKNGFSSIVVYNVSFICLRSFVEKVYKNVEISEVEDYMLQHIFHKKIDTAEENLQKSSVKTSHDALSPEADLFYTPKCSPSEIQKPFGHSLTDSPIKRKDNDVTHYYKIVSVDDVQLDDKSDRITDKPKDDCSLDEHLERELAEQDELLLSFKSIFSKVNKAKSNPQLGHKAENFRGKNKESLKTRKRVLQFDECTKTRSKCPSRTSPVVRDTSLVRRTALKPGLRDDSGESFSLKKKLEVHSVAALQEQTFEMDVSAAGVDSGLETSSSCQPEVSPRENTVSETSGVDLTDAAINEEIPHDEETVSTKPAESIGSSSSSDVGTWDANDENRLTDNDIGLNESVVLSENCQKNARLSYQGKENGLNEEEMARLDAMERNIRECEVFLDRERQIFYCYDNNPVIDANSDGLNSDRTISVLESVKDVIQNKLLFTGKSDQSERVNNNINNNNLSDESVEDVKESGDVTENLIDLGNFASEIDMDSDVLSKNNRNNQNAGSVLKQNNPNLGDEFLVGPFGSLTGDVDSRMYNAKEIFDMKTPPCSPRQICKMTVAVETEKKPDLIYPDIRSNYQKTNSISNNFFIDASSLLDEDEIPLPPVSLLSAKKEPEEVPAAEEVPVSDAYIVQEEERRQGDLIFKNSIPHFSRHEIEKTDETMKRLLGEDGFVPNNYENEQVVPSANNGDYILELNSEDDIQFPNGYDSLPSTLPSAWNDDSSLVDHPHGVAKSFDVDSIPIVSVGANPEDFSSSSSHKSSPHLRRRNESAPIVSGGMDYVEEKKERKQSVNQGAAWVVSFDDKPFRRRQTTATSESDMESLSSDNEKLKEPSNSQVVNNAKDDEKTDQRPLNPIEKSSSLGYFIDFSRDKETARDESVEKDKIKTKKNIFSMFIDMNDDKQETKTVPSFERQNTYDKETKATEDGVKKPFYMFIESDSPAIKRKVHQPPHRKLFKPFDAGEERRTSNGRRRTPGSIDSDDRSSPMSNSTSSLIENGSGRDDAEPKIVRNSKLPLPLSKSSSLTGMNRDAKMVLWSERKDRKGGTSSSGETWLKTNDVQVTYKARADGPFGDGLGLKIEQEESTYKRDGKKSFGFHLKPLEETKSPFKSPEERDSGIIVTEESDDSFVKLSDMDNFKNPYLEENKKPNVMSQSIPDTNWSEGKTSLKTGENQMSKSIGAGVVKSFSGSGFATDENVSRSLSRLFPNLNFSTGPLRRSNHISSPAGGKQDTDPSDTQMSEMSEISSLQSSIEPSTLEISTSETDVSYHNGTSRLGQDLLRMFLEEISPDVVVEVGGRRMKAHKCILSSRCQYFAAMLSGGWVESAGNVISLQGFSYNSVHFALCHIYSGENRIPDSLNIIELATLADMLCLEGLKEVISHTLKVKYCHCFHQPCEECHAGVLDCLPVAAAYGLDDLYRKCLRWVTKHFVRIWPSKLFAGLPKELLDKCYQHHVVHMTVENVLDTILNIDKIRGSLPNVRWAETINRLVTKLHNAALKYIADHFSSILTSDNFLALGKEDGWSVGRLEDSLMEAINRLPPEQACWSHARLHRILTVAKGPNPPSEMDWNEGFVDLLQCISGHVENSLIKQAPRAAKSKAWRQMEPELRNKIQERACLVLPDEAESPKTKKMSTVKREPRQNNLTSAARTNSRNLEIRHMKIAMTQVSRTSSSSRLQNLDQRPQIKDPRNLKPVASTTVGKKPEIIGKKSAILAPEVKKFTPSRFMDVKPRYLDPKSPQKTASDKPSNLSHIRRTRPLSSSDSSRNCSPLNANTVHVRPHNRQHRDSVVSTESGTSCDGKKEKTFARSETPSVKTLSRLTADENMSTDSLFTDSLYSEKDATTRIQDDQKSKGKENVRKVTPIKSSMTKTSSNIPSARKPNTESLTKSNSNRKLIAPASVASPKRVSAPRLINSNQKASPGRSSLASPRNVTNRNVIQKNSKADGINGNMIKKKRDVDSENNKNTVKDEKRPSTVSRSGTFLKDEPTILKKPQPEDIESSF